MQLEEISENLTKSKILFHEKNFTHSLHFLNQVRPHLNADHALYPEAETLTAAVTHSLARRQEFFNASR